MHAVKESVPKKQADIAVDVSFCWEFLREREFQPFGKQFWGEWFFRASVADIRELKALITARGGEVNAA